MFALASTFSACGGGGGDSTTTTPVVVGIEDISLSAGGSVICTNETSFTVTPTSDPDVIFLTDAQSGDTTIRLDSVSAGSLLVQNCTQN